MPVTRPFLTAQWRNLLMLNFDIDPAVLEPLVPKGTELDLWQGRSLVSLVGFQFLHSRLNGWPIPGHQSFVEVNLRFYVRRAADDGWRRGVVFVKEIVPKGAVRWVANTIYHENYVTLPMSHRVQLPGSATDCTGHVAYSWRYGSRECRISADFRGLPKPFRAGSEEEFITEHYWGYTRRRDGHTAEYRVEHPVWRVWSVDHAGLEGDVSALYGPQFAEALRQGPCSSLIAEGSPVAVYAGQYVPAFEMRQPPSVLSNQETGIGWPGLD